MKYQLFYHSRCLKRLKKIPLADRKRVFDKLQQLSVNPSSHALDIKKLASTKNSFRLRVGDLRAIYEPDQKKRIIYIWEIDYRGKVY